MSNHTRRLGLLIALLSLACLAGQAQAGEKMYQGSLRFEGYGNSRTDGHTLMSMATAATTWHRSTFLLEPRGAFCNYKNATIMAGVCATPPDPPAQHPTLPGDRCFISTFYDAPKQELIENCQRCVGGANSGNPCLGDADCPDGVCVPEDAPGSPITGSNTATTSRNTFTTRLGATACAGGACDTKPAIKMRGATTTMIGREITFIGGLGGMGSGSANYNLNIGENLIYSVTYVTLGTGPGTFFPGGGPPINQTNATPMNFPILGTPGGNSVFTYGPAQPASGYIGVDPGPNRFGGVMRLLGNRAGGRSRQFWWSAAFGGYLNTSLKFLFDIRGAEYRGQLCPYPAGAYPPPTYSQPFNVCPSKTTNFAGRTDGDMNPQYDMEGQLVTDFSTLIGTATRWTTGAAVISGPGFGFTTVLQRTGYDNRTPGGNGTIQLVTPGLTNWFFGGNQSGLGAITIMNLRFMPEPDSTLLVGAGLLFLAVLKRVRARR